MRDVVSSVREGTYFCTECRVLPGPPLDFIVSYLRWHRVGYRVLENDISMEQGTEVC